MPNIFESYQIANEAWINKSSDGACPPIQALSRSFVGSLKVLCPDSDLCPALIINNGLISCGKETAINCNLCDGDKPFFIPFEDGDTWMFQFHQPFDFDSIGLADANWKNLNSGDSYLVAAFDIIDACSGNVVTNVNSAINKIVIKKSVGAFNIYNYKNEEIRESFEQIKFNLQAVIDLMVLNGIVDANSFYFKFYFKNGLVTNIFDSEVFQKVRCEERITLESEYSSLDCNSYYYGSSYVQVGVKTNTFIKYNNRINILGYLEQSSFTIGKQVVDILNETTSSTQQEKWILKANFLPQKYVNLLSVVLAGKNLKINGEEFQFSSEVSRTNNIGCQWNIEVELIKNTCNNNLSCD